MAACWRKRKRGAEYFFYPGRWRKVAAQEVWSGRGDLNARPPAPKGAKSVPGGLSVFANPSGYNNPGNLLSLKEQVHRMERIGFGHSFGTVEWGEPLC